MAERTVVVGVFTDGSRAEQAMNELRQAGFLDDRIGFVVRDTSASEVIPTAAEAKTEAHTGATTGAVTGGVVGGLLGAAAALLIPGFGPAIAGGILSTLGGAAIGAAAGGLIGTFVSMGVPEEEAQYYQRELHEGRTVVIVQADGRQEEAFRILRHNQAYDASRPAEVATASTEVNDQQVIR